MAKREYKKRYILYCVLGKRDGKTSILGYSRNLAKLQDDLKQKGWRDEELVVESWLDES